MIVTANLKKRRSFHTRLKYRVMKLKLSTTKNKRLNHRQLLCRCRFQRSYHLRWKSLRSFSGERVV
ncbi:hypothetical protein MTR67_022250 [Solanum verrucosum]|uniref:Uncharacterized protein n=1 Tax=Solanum verrucosum TaxID=315347 RepID=A0AAF0QUC1_SOLVR|nr:hypothetical protein MTR67_022250 [Solanum verrucosum]